ncbi:MAG TPA: hypothetical protein VFF53_01485 [Geobacteraceae bacterium]|nr:hypothetical protein [Geobacteraceae bacterium]
MRRLVLSLCALTLLLSGGEALAWELNFPGAASFTQSEFKDMSKELGSALGYRNLAPAASLGITGFDVAAQASFIDIKDDSGYWKKAAGDVPGYVSVPSLRVRKGLPFGIDVGAMYSYVVDTNIKLYGVEVSKAILEGSLATPALGVRGTYTRLEGVDELHLQTAGVDASISKGLLFLTPYAGAGMLWIDSKPQGTLAAFVDGEKMWQPRGFVGVKISPLPLVGVTAEVEYAARPIYSLKAGLSF